MENAEHINPLNASLGVEVSLAHTSPKLCLDCICNQVLDLCDSYYGGVLATVKFIALLKVVLLIRSFPLLLLTF